MELSDKEWEIIGPLLPELPSGKRDRPISVLISSASCHEVGLVEPALDACWTSETPAILIGDKAYGSDPLDASLRCRGVEMVAPHKKNRPRAVTQDGGPPFFP